MTHYDTDIIAYNSVIIITASHSGFADEVELQVETERYKVDNTIAWYEVVRTGSYRVRSTVHDDSTGR